MGDVYFLALHIFEKAEVVELVIKQLLLAIDLDTFLRRHARVLLLGGLDEGKADLLLLADLDAAGGGDALVLLQAFLLRPNPKRLDPRSLGLAGHLHLSGRALASSFLGRLLQRNKVAEVLINEDIALQLLCGAFSGLGLNLDLVGGQLRKLKVTIDAAANHDHVLVPGRSCRLQRHDGPPSEVGHEPLVVLVRAILASSLHILA